MTPSHRVRRLSRHEWPAYRALRLRALADAPTAFATTLADARQLEDADWARRTASGAESPTEIALVAELDSQLVGLTWSRIDPADPGVAQLYQMWVEPGLRGRGVGASLLDAAVRWASGAGARFLELSVTCGNSTALRLYERAGFVSFGRREPLRAGSELEVQPMRRRLLGD